ncbi:vWA domain-containing protein [Halosimplex halophilum]|uniref:vWA domain-containing protein n=1 Tax=Halosimplex halophilum TaxID=2559572 RepID=UPI00107F67FC|nr:VWA domain-containing protein [Halosimplex halophilum]
MPTDRTRRWLLRTAAASAATALAGCRADEGDPDRESDRPEPAASPGADPTATPCPDTPTETPETPPPVDTDRERIDDWQYDPTPTATAAHGGGTHTATPMATATPTGGSVGLAAGGAKDVGTFRRNVEEGYLPLPESLSYEGLFYDYYFETGDPGPLCGATFGPAYAPAVTADPLSGETERYLTVGLNSGLAADKFERKRLNLVVVVDVSGSMSDAFDDYYYDRHGNERTPKGDTDREKIEVAREALVALTEQLRPGDRLGIVLYDDESTVAKPLRPVAATDMDAIREHVREDIEAGGGTRLSAGVADATDLLREYDDADRSVYENRTIVLTDAMPNLGETDAGDLRGRLADNADRGRYTTFVGVGVDFHAELVDAITSIRGANYYSVHSADEFTRRLGDEFKYMVTPLVFDLELTLDAAGYDIRRVYGTSAAEESTGRIMRVNTLFASPSEGGKSRGGVVLAQVDRKSADAALDLTVSWTDRRGRSHENATRVRFPDADPDYYANTGVRKAVLLSRYADLLKNWLVAEREADRETPGPDDGIEVPPPEHELGEWEQQSEPLTVSDTYEQRIREFREYFESEAEAIGDETLSQEAETMATILEQDDD